MGLKCKTACKHCPNTVVLGAEIALSIEVDGITATEYVRAPAAGGQGRALQGEAGDGVSVIQYADTIQYGSTVQYGSTTFDGEAGSLFWKRSLCFLRLAEA
jgi:hypothetical protein